MDISEYRARYFVVPAPVPLYAFEGIGGVTLYFAHYDEAVGFYAQVLGPPAYVEGPRTNGWRIVMTWRTLFSADYENSTNVELQLAVGTPAEADWLYAAFVAAGGRGEGSCDTLTYDPIRLCSVQDPFGTKLIITAQ